MTQYTQVTVLPGQKDGVLSIGFSACGTFLVATGYAGVCIWDVATQKDVAIPSPPSTLTEKHIYTRSVWLHFEDTGIPILVLGSMRGDMAVWKWVASRGAFCYTTRIRCSEEQTEVLSMDVLRRSVPCDEWGCVAVSTDNGRLMVCLVSPSGDQIRRLFVVDLPPPFCPKTVKFDASSRTIVAFSATGGTMARFDYDTGHETGHRDDGPDVMASVAVDPTKSIFAAHTGSSIEINLLKKQKHIKSIDIGAPDIYYPMYMAFGEGGDILVSGTDKGRALLHNVVDGSLVQTLFYPQGGLVQQVATCTVTDLHLVAIAGSSIRRPADVILYCKPRSEHGHVQIAKLTGAHRDPGTQESGTSAFERMCWGIMIALLIVYGAIVVTQHPVPFLAGL